MVCSVLGESAEQRLPRIPFVLQHQKLGVPSEQARKPKNSGSKVSFVFLLLFFFNNSTFFFPLFLFCFHFAINRARVPPFLMLYNNV